LAAEVATTYFDYLQYEYAEYISRSTLRSREDTYRLMESSYRAGTINEMELSQSRAAVATAQAAIPRFERARQQALHALSLLLGQNPSDDLIGRHASLAELDMPEEIPAGLPSDLLERRPDMQEAYYQVALLVIEHAFPVLFPCAQTDYADAVGSAMSSYVTLYKALGGGITMPATEAN